MQVLTTHLFQAQHRLVALSTPKMSTGPTVHSSVRLHERDKLLPDKHQNEIAILEKKLEKVKSISDETARHLFDAVNRGRRLAQSLGFNDVYDAQFAIDSVDDHDISFRECYDCLHRLEEQLSTEKKETESLRAKLHDAEVKVEELQAQLETRASDSRCLIYSSLYFMLILCICQVQVY